MIADAEAKVKELAAEHGGEHGAAHEHHHDTTKLDVVLFLFLQIFVG